jgi:Ca-activated chloride channel family protein
MGAPLDTALRYSNCLSRRYTSRMTRRMSISVVSVAALLLPGSIHASQQPSFVSHTLAVRVDVLVTDGRTAVGGLTARDFELRDDGVLQAISLVESATLPINVVLALDTSASIAGMRQTSLVAASQALLDGLKPGDRAALTTFNHAVASRLALTSDISAVRVELQQIMPEGQTAILDGVYVALTTTLAQPGRSLVVVCTDGADTSSWLQAGEVLESVKRSSAVIYAVMSADASYSHLEDLTGFTGGQVFKVASGTDLRAAFQNILQEFRSRYVLAYTPNGVSAGGFHRLDVRVKRRGLSVKARPGYIGLEPKK